jgi:hypothetical protein
MEYALEKAVIILLGKLRAAHEIRKVALIMRYIHVLGWRLPNGNIFLTVLTEEQRSRRVSPRNGEYG